MTHGDLLKRGRAAFLGLAVGDALGATTEFMVPGEIRDRYGVHRTIVGGGWLRLKPGMVTDDTEMSLCIARALVRAGGWDLRGIADNFAMWLRSKPVDVGAACRRGIRDYMLKGRLSAPCNEWDAGNGAVMRMTPVALLTLGDGETLARCAVEQARITHNHPLSDAACIAVGRMIQEAVLGAPLQRLRAIAEELALSHTAFAFEPYRGEASGYVAHTLQTVFHDFFAADGFEECLVRVVNRGGDADTTGAIAGSIAGAYYGPDAIPAAWRRRLDSAVRAEVEGLAEWLVRLSPSWTRSERFPDEHQEGRLPA
ncbi:MAG: ADP-ribosyl-[dinitrogen reductase] hydrolase [Deltaproteobacteria bacterium]|nr:ADP-ribosyl-[dinitrogen reductase] hydrolase [Deltaproteobacteria bacterium]